MIPRILVLPPRLQTWLPQFLAAESCFQVPAGLLAAICDRESRGGDLLKPTGPGGVGDGGHGRGLMQIDDRHHGFVHALFDDGLSLWKDPTFNIMYGARLLARNYGLTKTWILTVASYNARLSSVTRAAATVLDDSDEALIAAVDKCTTGGDYVAWVFARRALFETGNT